MRSEVREERPEDVAAVRDINIRAFGQAGEADLVDALRLHGRGLLSLVATLDGQVVGHIFYSPVVVDSISGAGLAPMAVMPEHQRRGIGSQLVTAGNRILQARGCPFIVVLGYPEFYPRFGFTAASRHGVSCEWTVPDDVFMMSIFDEEKMRGISGLAKYCPEFSLLSS